MKVHNVMEDIVEQKVNKLYDQLKKENPSWFTCDCENCRIDTISYVLNRIPPKYIVSERGMTHANQALNDLQLKADLDVVILEGIRTVNSTKRPYHTENIKKEEENPSPAFNFPLFTGTILDGSTFNPITNATVVLKFNGKPVRMIDSTWTNPCKTFKSTNGTYSFFAKSIDAKAENETKKFTFGIEVTAPGYEKSIYNFTIPVTSASTHSSEINSTYSLKIKDIILFEE